MNATWFAAAIRGAAIFCVLMMGIGGVSAAPRAESFTLSNGMQVVVVPDHRVPVVTHMVWYRVGGADGFSGVMNSALPRKRVIAHVLIRDRSGRVLLCETRFKPDWELPGGIVEQYETPRAGAAREVAEELGIELAVGRLLVVEHGHAVHTLYAHLSAQHVAQGEEVRQGQRIADIGATGRVTGPHLHFSLGLGPVWLDPQPLLPA